MTFTRFAGFAVAIVLAVIMGFGTLGAPHDIREAVEI